ncbi:MAG: deoxyribose-phosphate aldolase [Clostridium sp.]
MKKEELGKYIDHTLLKADVSEKEIEVLCKEAIKYGFKSVCINPCFVSKAKEILEGTRVEICTVIGFPLGSTTSNVKAYETSDAIRGGATEIDMVINISKLKDKDYDYVLNDIKSVVSHAKGKAIVKVIIETALLTDEQKKKAVEIAKEAGADFVKTSTGFSSGGATIDDVRLMVKASQGRMMVKASGGIKGYDDAVAMIDAGADRIGTSNSLKIIGVSNQEGSY